jgi:hypothetical protein
MKLAELPRVLVLAISSVVLCSCGLIFQGTTEEISVASDPPGATVTMNNGETRVTPFTITAPREQDLNFHFSKPGYQSVDLTDNSRVEPWVLFPDAFPLILPWAIDASAGAGFVHQQPSVEAHLERLPGGDASGNAAPSPAQPSP